MLLCYDIVLGSSTCKLLLARAVLRRTVSLPARVAVVRPRCHEDVGDNGKHEQHVWMGTGERGGGGRRRGGLRS